MLQLRVEVKGGSQGAVHVKGHGVVLVDNTPDSSILMQADRCAHPETDWPARRLGSSAETIEAAAESRRWNRQQIAEALPLVEEALRGGPGPFAVEAAIAALHCEAARAEDTDWPQIVRLYDVLECLQPSPIGSLNRAVAVPLSAAPRPALALIAGLPATR